MCEIITGLSRLTDKYKQQELIVSILRNLITNLKKATKV